MPLNVELGTYRGIALRLVELRDFRLCIEMEGVCTSTGEPIHCNEDTNVSSWAVGKLASQSLADALHRAKERIDRAQSRETARTADITHLRNLVATWPEPPQAER